MTTGLGGLGRLRRVETRSISPENFDGSPGGGGRATEGTGRVRAPATSARAGRSRRASMVEPGETFDLAEHRRPGPDHPHLDHDAHRQLAHAGAAGLLGRSRRAGRGGAVRRLLLQRLGRFAQVNSQPIAANPNGGFNSYWPMPFRSRRPADDREHLRRAGHASTTRSPTRSAATTRTTATCTRSGGAATRWPRRSRTRSSTAIEGSGHYVGTYLAWGVNSNGWWGEGEIKFFLDDDDRLPDDLRHRHRGLLRRRLELRRARSGLHRVLDALPRHAAGDPPGRSLRQPAAVRHVPLARAGPDPLRHRTCSVDHPGARLAQRAAATCRCRTTSPRPRCSTSTARPPVARSRRRPTTWRSTRGGAGAPLTRTRRPSG